MMMVARHFRRRLLILSVSTLGFFISSFSVVLASDFTGPVVSVLDGDTLEVLHDGKAERIRLNGIDCHEKGQALTCLTQDSNCALRKSLDFEAPFLKAAALQIDKELQKDDVVNLVD